MDMEKASSGYPDRGVGLFIASVVMVVLAGFFVSARFVYRSAERKLGIDDWLILASLVSKE